MVARIAAVLALLASPAFAEALPVFSDTGPDAAAFGAAEGYPAGTRATLSQQRHMVGAYSHYDQVLTSRPVARAAAASPFGRAESELALTYTHLGQPHTLADYLDRHPTTGLLIERDGTILYEHYRYARTDRDRFTSQSMAKTVLAMLVGIAVAEGKIRSIDDSASIYVPELAGTQLGRTPIRALLHMASGIAFTEVYNGRDDMARLAHGLFRPGNAGAATVLSQFDTRVAEPGTVWHYAGLNSELLGLVLTNATRMQIADYLATRIWQRIGTEADASWVVDATGQEVAYCCFNATLRDWARFGMLLAQDGAWGGAQVIPRQWVLDATTVPADSFLAPGKTGRTRGYGYQVWIQPGPRRQFALIGVHGQTILIDPAARLVLVHTAVRPKAAGDPMSAELVSLWNALVAQEAPSP
ncbi:serine hydrolase domain-containing protein [Limobrevibacterium gyesilva]|uniref:Beta-lactamase family protein n=1 Tax=Limobrevibacterium gyesilva TaxID=2991712 RepID=A0AA41YMI8_9PROT|nr:serine hydrolase [Limobrevibacterium gyesilva]MCW3474733.1 beta-lactamase family protein [Limobrevibacterium gyesilva]